MTLYFIQRQDLIASFVSVRIKTADIMFQYLKIFLLFFFGSQQLNADVLVRMEVQQGAAISNVDLRLFEEDAPLTVANFLKYVVIETTVNGGSYDNSFIHRSVTDFVVQGGGFTFDPTVNDGSFSYNKIDDIYPGGLQEVAEDPPVINEFNRSSWRGTIAMAKLGDDPDSATSQWFFNLADNSSILDGQNGGFTVFGEVISDGMTIVDEIASLTKSNKFDIHNAFAELPLVNYTDGPVQQENLVRINTIIELLSISTDIDFGPVASAESDITIKNTGNANHSIGGIATTDTLDVPFTIIADACSNTDLDPGAECSLTIQFFSQSENVFSDSFNIEFTDLALSYSFSLTGGLSPDILPSLRELENGDLPLLETLEYGEVQLYDPLNGIPPRIFIFVHNVGNLDLNVSSVTLDGVDAVDFEMFDNCTEFKPVVPPGDFCGLTIDFKPLTTGEKSATLSLISDDPDESPLVMPITGTASIDTDGVPLSVEDAGPNGGDGNNDGILDSIQSDVVSLPGINGSYITLLTSSETRITNISILAEDLVVAPADNIQFKFGLLDFKVDKVAEGGTIEIGIILPPGEVPTSYYMYGPTSDNTIPHWYEFLFDGTTGAQLIGKATIPSPVSEGVTIERNLINLVFKDGERGDADLSANGAIDGLGGFVVSSANTNSGSLNVWLLLYLSGIVVLFRLIQHNRP